MGNKSKAMLQAVISALLFGASAPLSKLLLGSIDSVLLASLTYLGSGIGLSAFYLLENRTKGHQTEAALNLKDIPWLLGAIAFGGVIAPIVLMISLKSTPASTASLLLNFEGVATTTIAALVFKESIGKRIWMAIAGITAASMILTYDFGNQWGFSLGALGIITACICWGIDNNLTKNISSKNPYTIVIGKGLGAGSFSLLLSLMLGVSFPDARMILLAMLLGCFSYGISIVLFVYAMRELGSARTSAFFGTAPFIGTILSFAIFGEIPGVTFLIGFPIMVIGAVLLLKEKHHHLHRHEYIEHEHKHNHIDEHHKHTHMEAVSDKAQFHTHKHIHESIEHEHEHTPDLHHRHKHA